MKKLSIVLIHNETSDSYDITRNSIGQEYITVIHSQQVDSHIKQVNFGIRQIEALNYLILRDVYLMPETIDQLLHWMMRYRDVIVSPLSNTSHSKGYYFDTSQDDLVYSSSLTINDAERIIAFDPKTLELSKSGCLISTNIIDPHCFIMPHEAIEQVGYFNEKLTTEESFEQYVERSKGIMQPMFATNAFVFGLSSLYNGKKRE